MAVEHVGIELAEGNRILGWASAEISEFFPFSDVYLHNWTGRAAVFPGKGVKIGGGRYIVPRS